MGAHIIPLILGRKAQCVDADADTSTQDWGPVEGQLKFSSNGFNVSGEAGKEIISQE